jgi:hypothetical protein
MQPCRLRPGRAVGARLLLAKAVSAGVALLEAPRCVSYGLVAVFSDLCGNKRDVIERR